MINAVTLVGRLTKDVDLRYTQNGKAVGNFTLAVNRPFTNQNGDREADFILCQVWGKQAENTAQYTSKGSLVGVNGRISTRNYENNQGQRVYVTEVVADQVAFLDSKKDNQQQNNQPTQQSNQQQSNNQNYDDPFKNNGEPIDISDDSLPF